MPTRFLIAYLIWFASSITVIAADLIADILGKI